MKDLKTALIASGQTAAYSNQIVKAIDQECVFETLSEMPVDEIITVAFMDYEDPAEIKASINRSIERLQKSIAWM